MDVSSAHSSIYVAPLHITKIKSRRKSGSSIRSRKTNSSNGAKKLSISKSRSESRKSSCSEDTAQASTESAIFHNYLQATHQYCPEFDPTSASVTVPFNTGDVFLVHSVHTNGWADATLLLTGQRGWVPTNFCEILDQEPNRMLMKALTAFWDLLHGVSSDNYAILSNQDYMRGLVAGVRLTLEKTSCLNRESALVQSHTILRQTRKALLCDLSSLVKKSKQIQNEIHRSSAFQLTDEDLNELVLKAFQLITRAVKFAEVWTEDVLFEGSVEFASLDQSAIDDSKTKPDSAVKQTRQSSIGSQRHSKSGRDSRLSLNGRSRLARSSQTWVRPGATESDSVATSRPASARLIRNSHRPSVVTQLSPRMKNFASERLVAAQSTFVGLLGRFLGPYMQAHSTMALLFTTKEAVNACNELISVVELVESRVQSESTLLQAARDDMYASFAEFLEVARDILQQSHRDGDEVASMDDMSKLGSSATTCIRGTGDCVSKTRFMIERIGDFEVDSIGLGISSPSDIVSPLTPEEGGFLFTTEKQVVDELFPPEPLGRPPPPPMNDGRPGDVSQPAIAELPDNRVLPRVDTSSRDLLPPLPDISSPLFSGSDFSPTSQMSYNSDGRRESLIGGRVESIGVSSAGSASTYIGSTRDSERSGLSSTSTRATSPDTLSPSTDEECEATEAKIMEKTYAHELTYNGSGQIIAGSLPALVERLTVYDSTPDAFFVSTFYLTFRLFATPTQFAQALIDRFNYVSDSPHIMAPVRLRVYNAFKGWLESHWRNDCDTPALVVILPFAMGSLAVALPAASKRVLDLIERASNTSSNLVPRLISSIGKTNTSLAQYIAPDTPMPPPIFTRSQLSTLEKWKKSGTNVNILDFDPLELARQLTIKTSRIFCSILPEELLASEWTKKKASLAVHVRAMSTISTDLTNLVSDCILQLEDCHKRAKLIKQWIKVADKCLELNNYDSLMAIVCSLTSATISRLKRTWDIISVKTKATLENLNSVVELSRNYAALRQRLQDQVPPCLPFVGIYLTDLTFVDLGNPSQRPLPGEGSEKASGINFDKHMKTARVIGELQRFQIPYRLTEVPELQIWLQDQLIRVRRPDENTSTRNFRRSLVLEPRERTATTKSNNAFENSMAVLKEKDEKPSFLSSFKRPSNHKDRQKQEDFLRRAANLTIEESGKVLRLSGSSASTMGKDGARS
ncbi:hypothetical protein MMC25_001994 [Agyrium rufum]|nr:hypothetical protein [Agyrium rufum]